MNAPALPAPSFELSRAIEDLRPDEPPLIFAVCSWGNAGAQWLSRVIDAHPFAFCVCNARDPIAEAFDARRRGVADYYRALEWLGGGSAALGDVHAVPFTELAQLREIYGARFRGAGLVGHPLVRLTSSVMFWKRLGIRMPEAEFLAGWSLEPDGALHRQLRQLLGARGDYRAASYTMQCNNIVRELQHARLFRIEDLMARPEALDGLFRFISDGRIGLCRGLFECFADRDFGEPQRIMRQPPREAWALLSPEEQAAVRCVLSPAARNIYAHQYDYDLSMLDEV